MLYPLSSHLTTEKGSQRLRRPTSRAVRVNVVADVIQIGANYIDRIRSAPPGITSYGQPADRLSFSAALLAAVRAVLRPGSLFFVGAWGGNESAEGPIDGDEHVPPRFFSRRTDEQLLGFATDARFDVVDFHRVDTGPGHWFQSLTLSRT